MIKRLKLDQSKFLLFYLLPITFIAGPAIVELCFFLLSLIILFIFKKKIINKENKHFLYFFIFFYIYLNLNSFFSVDILNSFKSSIPYLRYLFAFIAISYFLMSNLNILLKSKHIFILIFSILFIDSMIQFIFGKNIIGFPIIDEGTYRISSFFGNELILGGYIARTLPILLGLIFFSADFKKNENINLEVLILCAVSLTITLLSGERVAFFQVVLITLFTIFFLISSKNIKYIFVLILVIFLTSVFSTNNKIKTRMFVDTLNIMKEVDKFSNIDSKIILYSQVHHSHIISGYKMFLDSPILGHGLKSFRKLCSKEKYVINKFSCTTHPHNIFIQFLSELGIIGIIFYFISFFYFLVNFFKDMFRLNKPYVKSKQCVVFSILLFYLPIPSGSFFNNYMSYQFYYLIIFYILYLCISKKSFKSKMVG